MDVAPDGWRHNQAGPLPDLKLSRLLLAGFDLSVVTAAHPEIFLVLCDLLHHRVIALDSRWL
jgi:hypothetical protein